jgi:hypothetical protein
MSEHMSEQAAGLDLDAIRARAEAATDGPWAHVIEQDGDESGPNGQDAPTRSWFIPAEADADFEPTFYQVGAIADAEFIAHARTDVPALVAEVERLTGIVDGLCALCGGTRESSSHLVGCPDLERALVENATLTAVLGAVAALAKDLRDRAARAVDDGWRETVLLETSNRLRAVLAPVSGAVEGAGGITDAAVVAAVKAHTERANRFVPYDPHECFRAVIAAALPHLIPPHIPVAKHEQEVRAEWEVKVLNAFLNNPPESDEACRYLPDFIASLTKTMIDARADALTEEQV